MTFAEMLRGSPLNQQRMADDNAMNLAGMLARGRAGTVQQEPNMVERGLSNAKRSFYGDKNLYGNDPINPSVLDSQYVSPEMAEGAVLDVVGGPMATAWHGSPHLFKKFDMSKIGTGEGAQAYGHGLYMAENPKVAKEYADELTRKINVGENIIQGKGETIGTTGIEDVDDYLIADRGDASLALANMKKDRLEIANSSYPENAKSYDAGIEMLEGLVKRGEVQNTTSGNLYKVDIPDDQIAQMLDWDKVASDMPDEILDRVKDANVEFGLNLGNASGARFYKDLSDSFYKKEKALLESKRDAIIGKYDDYGDLISARTKMSLEDRMAENALSKQITDLLGVGEVKASDYLRSKGIPGIKYLDQGSRQGGKGTSNFVLFADDIAKILERNDQPIGDLAEELLGK